MYWKSRSILRIYLPILLLFILVVVNCANAKQDEPQTGGPPIIDETISILKKSTIPIKPSELVKGSLSELNKNSKSPKIDFQQSSKSLTISCNDYSASYETNQLDYSKTSEVFNQILINCLKLDKANQHAVIKAMVDFLGQKYSSFAFIPKKSAKSTTKKTKPEAASIGIGLTLRKNEKTPTVMNLLENSPEWLSGVKQGDQILAINGVSAEGKSLDKIRQMLNGKSGSSVLLTLLREGWVTPKKITLKRRKVLPVYVESKLLKNTTIGFLRILSFKNTTHPDVTGALTSLLDKKISHLIIDLRGNPGGSVYSVGDVISLFVPKGRQLFSAKDYNGKRLESSFNSTGQDIAKDIPVAIIIDEETEGGAELMAATLKDLGRAMLYGEVTRGDADIFTMFTLRDNSLLIVPIGEFFRPSGKKISGVGVKPDKMIKIDREKFSFDKTDPVISEAISSFED